MVARQEALKTPFFGSKLAQSNSNIARVADDRSWVAAVPGWVSSVPNKMPDVARGGVAALANDVVPRPRPSTSAATAAMPTPKRRRRVATTAFVRDPAAVFLGRWGNAMAFRLDL